MEILKRGMNQRDFAKSCGLSPSTIAKIISGRAQISARSARAISTVLGKSVNFWLLPSVQINDAVLDAFDSSPNVELTPKAAKRMFNEINIQHFVKTRESLEKYTGNDDKISSNYLVLPISCAELEVVRLSLSFIIISRELPNWSNGMLFHLNGAIAVLKGVQDLIPESLRQSWNSMMEGLKFSENESKN